MKKGLELLIVVILLVFGIFVLAAQATGTESSKTRIITFSHVFAATHPVNVALLEANEMLKEKTEGRYELGIFPHGTLYSKAEDAVKAIEMGAVDMAVLGSGILYYPPSGVLLSPYTFRDYDHWKKFKESDVYKDLLKNVEANSRFHMFKHYTFGFRNVTSNKLLTTPDEFKGIKLRVVGFAPYPEAATVLNAVGTPMPIGDTYMALKTGVIDAEENPATQVLAMKFYEVQKYFIETRHILATAASIMSNKCWSSLSSEDKNIFEEVFKFEAKRIDEIVIQEEKENIEKLKEYGMKIIEVDRKPFMDRVELVFKKYPEFADIYEKIQAIK